MSVYEQLTLFAAGVDPGAARLSGLRCGDEARSWGFVAVNFPSTSRSSVFGASTGVLYDEDGAHTASLFHKESMGMGYVAARFASTGFTVSWGDRMPGKDHYLSGEEESELVSRVELVVGALRPLQSHIWYGSDVSVRTNGARGLDSRDIVEVLGAYDPWRALGVVAYSAGLAAVRLNFHSDWRMFSGAGSAPAQPIDPVREHWGAEL